MGYNGKHTRFSKQLSYKVADLKARIRYYKKQIESCQNKVLYLKVKINDHLEE